MTARLALGLAATFAILAHVPALAQTTAPTKPDIAKGQGIAAQVCAACHMADGNSGISANPILAGQGESYLLKQLRGYKAEKGKDGARANAIMSAQAAVLSDDDIRNLAAYYAAQKPKQQSARNKELVGLGERIYRGGIADRGVAACAGCHGPTGAGIPAQYPRLAGQHSEYTEAQMKLWRTGERANDPNRMMQMVSAKMNDAEIKAVSDYIQGLR